MVEPLIVYEEDDFGISLVARVLAQHHPVPIEVVAVQDLFGTSGQPEELFVHYGLTEHDIAAKTRMALQRKGN